MLTSFASVLDLSGHTPPYRPPPRRTPRPQTPDLEWKALPEHVRTAVIAERRAWLRAVGMESFVQTRSGQRTGTERDRPPFNRLWIPAFLLAISGGLLSWQALQQLDVSDLPAWFPGFISVSFGLIIMLTTLSMEPFLFRQLSPRLVPTAPSSSQRTRRTQRVSVVLSAIALTVATGVVLHEVSLTDQSDVLGLVTMWAGAGLLAVSGVYFLVVSVVAQHRDRASRRDGREEVHRD